MRDMPFLPSHLWFTRKKQDGKSIRAHLRLKIVRLFAIKWVFALAGWWFSVLLVIGRAFCFLLVLAERSDDEANLK